MLELQILFSTKLKNEKYNNKNKRFKVPLG